MNKLALALSGILACSGAGYYYCVNNVVPKYLHEKLPAVESMADNYINGKVKIKGFTWGGGLSFEVDDVVVTDKNQTEVVVLPKTIVSLRPWLGIFDKTEKVVSKIEFVNPEVYLTMDEKQKWNMQSLLKPSDSDETPFYGQAQITNGKLHVAMPQGKWDFGVEGIVEGGANPKFNFDTVVSSGNDKIKLTGLMTSKALGKMTINADNVALAPYASLVKNYADIKDFSGDIKNLHLLYDNEKEKLSISGQAEFSECKGKVYLSGEEHSVAASGKLKASDNIIALKNIDAKLDDNQAHFEGELDLTEIEKPKGAGTLTAKELTYAKRTIRDVIVPFVADGKLVTVNKAAFKYGEGSVETNASYAVSEQTLAADINFKNVVENFSSASGNEVRANGLVAVLAKVKDDGIDIKAAGDTVDFAWQNIKLNRVDFDGSYKNNNLIIEHISALSDQGNFAAKGVVDKNGKLDLEGRMVDFPIDPFIEMATGEKGSGLASTKFNLKGSTAMPEFSGLVQFRNVNFMKQFAREGHGFLGLKDNKLTIKGFEANMEQGKHVINGTVDLTGEDPVLDLSVETDNVRIEPLVAVVSSDLSVTGNIDNILQIQGSVKHPLIYGEVHASDGSAQKQLFSNIDGRYSYEDGLLTLKDFVVDAFLGKISLDGKMNANKELDFKLDAKDINLEKLPIKESEYDIDGFVNAHGKLLGTMDEPYFEGAIDSEEISLNKEKIVNLSGKVNTNTKEVNHLVVAFDQPYDNGRGCGRYEADLNLNRVVRNIQGNILTKGGDVAGVLRAFKQPYNIKGYMNGSINVNPFGFGSGIHADVHVDNVKVHNIPYHEMKFVGKLQKGILSFEDVMLQEKSGDIEHGVVTVNGDVDFKNKNYNVDVNAKDANPALVTAFMKEPPEIKGETDMHVKLNGPFSMPNGVGNITIKNGNAAGVRFDVVEGQFTLGNDHIDVKDILAINGPFSARAYGDIPLDIFRSKSDRKNSNAQMDITLDMNEARLTILPAITKYVEWANGETQGKLKIAGTLEEPHLYGKVKISEGNIKVKDINTVLENVELDADFQGKKVELTNFSTKLGKGKFSAQGSYSPYADAATSYNMHLIADKAEINSEIFKGLITSDIVISPHKYYEFNKVQPGKTAPEAWRSLVKGNIRFDDVLLNIATVPDTEEGNSNLGLDLKFELGPKVHMLNSKMYDIWLKGGVDVKGSTRFPIIDGNIQSAKGSITYMRTHFKLNKAKLTWIEPGSFLPNVDLSSKARFSRYNIYMDITGPIDQMDLKLTSDPPQDRNTLIRMLTLQRDTATNNDFNSNDATTLAAAGLEMAVLADVEMWIKQTLGLDQFRVYTGKVRSGVGYEGVRSTGRDLSVDEKTQYNILVSRYLTDKFLIGYTTSFNGLDRTMFGQYDISKHLNLTYSRSYELNGKPENWYGLEYNVNF